MWCILDPESEDEEGIRWKEKDERDLSGKTKAQLGGASFGLKAHPGLHCQLAFAEGITLLLTSKCSTELCHESPGEGWPQGLWCHFVCRGAAVGADAPPTLIQSYFSSVSYSRCFHVFRFLPSTYNIFTSKYQAPFLFQTVL